VPSYDAPSTPQRLDGTTLESSEEIIVLGGGTVIEETTTGAEDMIAAAAEETTAAGKLLGPRGTKITTVPVWPIAVGAASVDGTATEMPVTDDVMVVKS
jgi:hypothetical protein